MKYYAALLFSLPLLLCAEEKGQVPSDAVNSEAEEVVFPDDYAAMAEELDAESDIDQLFQDNAISLGDKEEEKLFSN